MRRGKDKIDKKNLERVSGTGFWNGSETSSEILRFAQDDRKRVSF